ncbi:MAG TPA: hypothetical protein VGE02_11400 [Gemmatimonadales bacterium]
MRKQDLQLPGSGEYALVADRITLFYDRYPEGRIITELVSRGGGEVTFRALVYRSPAEPEPAATGWASEREGDGDVNSVACLENTETSAIGRALANLGFTASTQRPSAEEMAKASRARARLSLRRVSEPVPAPSAPSTPSTPSTQAVPADDRLRADVRLLLEVAEREGVKPARLAAARRSLERAGATREELERLERGVRAWLERRRAALPVAPTATAEDVRGRALQG